MPDRLSQFPWVYQSFSTRWSGRASVEPDLGVRPETRAELRKRFEDLGVPSDAPLYVIPDELQDRLRENLGKRWSIEARKAEKELHARARGSLGLDPAGNGWILNTLLPRRSYKRERGEKLDVSKPATLARLLGQVDDLRCAYSGWLITEPTFLSDLDILKRLHDRTTKTATSGHEADMHAYRKTSDAFYRRWWLARVVCWALPEPALPQRDYQRIDGGPISGIRGFVQTLRLPVPLKFGPPPQVVTGAADLVLCAEAPEHLCGWQEVCRTPEHGGPDAFARVLEVRWWRDFVLGSRMESFPPRCEGKLDESVAQYLGLSADRIRQLRRLIGRRIAGDWRASKRRSTR